LRTVIAGTVGQRFYEKNIGKIFLKG